MALGVLHLLEDPVGAHGLDIHVALALDVGRGRDQIVAPIELYPMPCVVEQSDGIGAGLSQTRTEVLDGSLHGQLIGLPPEHDIEAQLRQGVTDQLGVVSWI